MAWPCSILEHVICVMIHLHRQTFEGPCVHALGGWVGGWGEVGGWGAPRQDSNRNRTILENMRGAY